ncbi:type II secretion system F family protein [Isachenkonia alkalipeptolytica]|uniref:Type II secretion system F family protein n=1 Tax=Isachenkonia alkalipeptolytica TaxID=2565777 RepID=A0AA43XIP9_9CLOT|nr:type II secretion system F family protein [Isachenkonia alkalipeptolytica]NBG87533.1 type II secretion system F family protein [Isachenkonia alkalipeptolytica]
MAVYKYTAVTPSGQEVEETITGNSLSEVQDRIKEKGYFVIDVTETVEKKSAGESLSFGKGVKTKDLSILCKQMGTLLKAGVPLSSALDILYRQTENKSLKEALGDVYAEVQKGSQISGVMKEHPKVFPELMVNMTESGEMTGNLDNVMERLAVHYEKEAKIESRITGAMIYPIVLSVVAITVVVFLLVVVMPTFIGMFEGAGMDLPLPTRILIGISNALRDFWYLFILGAVGLGFLFNRFVNTETGRYRFDALKFKIPIVKSSMDKIVTARFTRTLGSLLSSGIPLMDSLEMTGKVVGNAVIEEKIETVTSEVEKGETLGKSLKRNPTFGPMIVSMIEIGEESGNLDGMLDKSADFYERELEDAIDRMIRLLEPLMIVVMAIVIGFIVVSMALPMFDMFQTI